MPSEDDLRGWRTRPPIEPVVMAGRFVRLEPVDPDRHAESLFAASIDRRDDVWRYMFYGPFSDLAAFRAYLDPMVTSVDPVYLAVTDVPSATAVGIVSFLRVAPEHGCVEIGHIWFSPEIQRSLLSTEAMYLLARHVFEDLGYRRLEWKCDSANLRSRRAAERLGFTFEGIFRRHMVIKGRNRDTAWYAMLDRDWLLNRDAFIHWLDDQNFDEKGRQRLSLNQTRQRLRGVRTSRGAGITIRSAEVEDEPVWRKLWRGYTDFYETEISAEIAAATWRRLLDPTEPMGCILALHGDAVIGFANYIDRPSTWTLKPVRLLDDLYVAPEARGLGAGRELIQRLVEHARELGMREVYWITKADNTTARHLYDTFAPPDGFIQYTVET